MTREEQLTCLKDRPCNVCKMRTDKGCNSWECVFEQMPDEEKEPCDCISREEVSDYIAEFVNHEYATDREREMVKNIIGGIQHLPSVQPKPKTEWISVGKRLPKSAGVYRVTRCYPNNVLVDACYFDGSNTWYNDNRINHARGYVDNIIAWQENPEPYKPTDSEKE